MKTGLLAMCVFVGTVGVGMAQEQAPKPNLRDGEVWQYRITEKDYASSSTEALNGSYEVSLTQGKVSASYLNGSAKESVNTDADEPGEILALLLGGNERRPEVKFPLAVGQKWTYEYKFTPRASRTTQSRSAEVNVVGFEEITTSAGNFKAFKLVRSERWARGPRQGMGGSSVTYFYSPETKSVVKSLFENDNGGKREIELTKYVAAQ